MSSSALTEANVEAMDFRLDFAQETLQSFKDRRARSRSPRISRSLQHEITMKDIQIQGLLAQCACKDGLIAELNKHIAQLHASWQQDRILADLKRSGNGNAERD